MAKSDEALQRAARAVLATVESATRLREEILQGGVLSQESAEMLVDLGAELITRGQNYKLLAENLEAEETRLRPRPATAPDQTRPSPPGRDDAHHN